MIAMLPVKSTYISDPAVTHYVESYHPKDGSGIQGWYICELDAYRVARYLKQRGHLHVKVRPFSDYSKINGLHPLIALSFGV